MQENPEEVVLTQEQSKAAEDAAFNAEMADEPVDVKSPAAEPAPEVPQGAEQESEPERIEVIPGYTKEEVAAQFATIAKLQKSLDTANGTYGQKMQVLYDEIERLKSQQPKTQDGVGSGQLSVESFKRLKAQYPELTESLAQDLSEIMVLRQSGVDVDQIRNEFIGQLQERDQKIFQMNMRQLQRQHPDYMDIATFERTDDGFIRWSDQKFGNWVSQQSDEIRNAVLQSDDPYELTEILGAYKDATNTVKQPDNRTSRLERAIQPKGTGAERNMSAKEIEEEAYRREMAS